MVLSYGTTITYNGIQWRHNTLQWDQCATTYLARDHNNSQWRTMETQGITMGPMRDNIPCKVTTEHSAFPDARLCILPHTHVDSKTEIYTTQIHEAMTAWVIMRSVYASALLTKSSSSSWSLVWDSGWPRVPSMSRLLPPPHLLILLLPCLSIPLMYIKRPAVARRTQAYAYLVL